MDLKKCTNCSQLFAAARGQRICPECLEEEEQKFDLVKDYLWDNPGATIPQVSEATDVGEPIIEKFVREGRLVEVQGSNMKVECRNCGKPISKGKFCSECSNKLATNIQKSKSKSRKKNKRDQEKMFTRD